MTPHTATSTSHMVSSADVNGTAVYSPKGEHLGHIDHLMIDKESGVIAYAVMAFGGFLGLAEDHHPIPWKKLSYDQTLGGFVTDITREQLEGAPQRGENWREDRTWGAATYNYYGVPPYWI
ncbi:PRC-barrel domain containing protein [Cereibacter sphaeroides]|uniref:PRC-barrel domain-containing protein n=1 Tax=Cereibacter sphaeroides TaxID=1063 RepID=UPI000E5BE884|nr:PRC-barrel domain-containing protein [Cereibacter sphaeroides]RIA00222.1 PRC-barrel domain containing protein [Cereibacter sphaeroides]